MTYKVLIADDMDAVHKLWIYAAAMVRKHHDFTLNHAYDGQETIQLLDEIRPHILITDYMMPKRNGCYVARYARNHHPDCIVVLKSAHGKSHNCPCNRFDMYLGDDGGTWLDWALRLDEIVRRFEIAA